MVQHMAQHLTQVGIGLLAGSGITSLCLASVAASTAQPPKDQPNRAMRSDSAPCGQRGGAAVVQVDRVVRALFHADRSFTARTHAVRVNHGVA